MITKVSRGFNTAAFVTLIWSGLAVFIDRPADSRDELYYYFAPKYML